jgi:hypothetical protein
MGISGSISVNNTVLAYAVKCYLWTLTLMLILCLSRTFKLVISIFSEILISKYPLRFMMSKRGQQKSYQWKI